MTHDYYYMRRAKGSSVLRNRVWQIPPEKRFWSKVNKTPDGEPGCWIRKGNLDRGGYGRFVVERREIPSHQFSFELAYGPVPDGKLVLHKCGDRRCVRPDHLYLGKARPAHATGAESHNARLTREQVEAIRSRYAEGGHTQRVLAEEFGVSQTTVHRILQHETWR